MKLLRAAVALACAAALVSCGDDDGSAVDPDDLTPDVPVVVRTATALATSSPGTPDAGAEVQGIVGAVNEDAGTIEINRLQGVAVDKIRVSAGTRITSAGGRALQLADLRPSDRIVAKGSIEGDVLVASEITVGQVVPGSDPGG